ncbi:hypothetical protein [Telmatospirillum sp.]|uniref:hypothetical protein n=1 Tax=Telmatospirillum sp. TaxID=2079197 RepID=UPI00283B4827|nr:hypothetical protein [Telmatospirillum sp.]MDR3439194.1 hypothetical protein [Telmatospirillum sp.]
MFKLRFAFYAAAIAFAVLINVSFDAEAVANFLNAHGITAEQLSTVAQAVETIN